MSGSVAKATRRDLRRAIGVGAVQLVDAHEQGLQAHAQSLKFLERRINAERDARLELATEQRGYVDRGDKLTDAKVDAFLRRGFWSRLNWLLRGK